jgi:dual specificity tyrosine-phosphorylation-regulated kinase 2/3/4
VTTKASGNISEINGSYIKLKQGMNNSKEKLYFKQNHAKLHLQITNYAWRKKQKVGPHLSMLGHTMTVNTHNSKERSPENKRNALENKTLDAEKIKITLGRIQKCLPKLSKKPHSNKNDDILYKEYFTQKRSVHETKGYESENPEMKITSNRHSYSSILTNLDSKTLIRKRKGKKMSWEKSQPTLSISMHDYNKERSIEENGKSKHSFLSPSLKSISFPLKTSKNFSSGKKRNAILKKYKDKLTKFQTQSFESTRPQRKIQKAIYNHKSNDLKIEQNKKSLNSTVQLVSTKFQRENIEVVKAYPLSNRSKDKYKSLSSNKRNNSIMKSLNELKKSLKSGSLNEKPKRNHKGKSNSLHLLQTDNPVCDSNKTKDTCTESPTQKFPLEVEQMITLFADRLSQLEKVELRDYKENNETFKIYFLGDIPRRKSSPPDEKFDNEEGYYRAKEGSNIYFRYEIKSLLGKGSFGKVYLAFDHKEKKKIALKILRSFPKDDTQIDLEPEILMYLKKKCEKKQKTLRNMHIIDIGEYFEYRLHKCITMPIYQQNLYEKLNEQKIDGFDLNAITIQLLKWIKFLKENRVIHWDLKPENILLENKTNSDVLVIDFGSSCFEDKKMYAYIQSRFYRAPEILLGIPYSYPIDMWSLGCILMELYIGFPIFPGQSEKEQMGLIMELRGVPPINILEEASRKDLFFNEDLTPKPVIGYNEELLRPNSKSLAHFIDPKHKNFIKFIDACLHWDPDLRMTPEEGLRHDWVIEECKLD